MTLRVVVLLVAAVASLAGCQGARDVLLGPSTTVAEQRAPTPTPSPSPEPTPEPSPEPSPAPPADDDSIPDDIPDNTNPVVKVLAKLYHIECGGQLVEVPAVGCRLHLDATPVDAYGKHTQSRSGISWNAAGPVRPDGGGAFTPSYRVTGPGEAVFVATVDGVPSNVVRVRIP